MRLSFAVPAAPAAGAAAADAQRLACRPLRILLVDDDPLVLKSLRDTLGGGRPQRNGGRRRARRASMRSSLRRLRAKPFPVVITDLGMPMSTGRKVSQRHQDGCSGNDRLAVDGLGAAAGQRRRHSTPCGSCAEQAAEAARTARGVGPQLRCSSQIRLCPGNRPRWVNQVMVAETSGE